MNQFLKNLHTVTIFCIGDFYFAAIATIKKLCDCLDITLGQFFSCALFDELEQEIQ